MTNSAKRPEWKNHPMVISSTRFRRPIGGGDKGRFLISLGKRRMPIASGPVGAYPQRRNGKKPRKVEQRRPISGERMGTKPPITPGMGGIQIIKLGPLAS